MAQKKPEKIPEFVTLTYPGLSEKEMNTRLAAFKPKGPYDDGFVYPEAPGKEDLYKFLKRDSDRDRKLKTHRRKKFQDERLAELGREVEELDAVRTICGVTFEKGVPQEINMHNLGEGEARKLLYWAKQRWLLRDGEDVKSKTSGGPYSESAQAKAAVSTLSGDPEEVLGKMTVSQLLEYAEENWDADLYEVVGDSQAKKADLYDAAVLMFETQREKLAAEATASTEA